MVAHTVYELVNIFKQEEEVNNDMFLPLYSLK